MPNILKQNNPPHAEFKQILHGSEPEARVRGARQEGCVPASIHGPKYRGAGDKGSSPFF